MSDSVVEKIAEAILYEGYLLYPYRRSAIKNRQRFNFGVLFPLAYCQQNHDAESWQQQTEVLLQGDEGAAINIKFRFLQLFEDGAIEGFEEVPDFTIADLLKKTLLHQFTCGGAKTLTGEIEIAASPIAQQIFKISVRTSNLTPLPPQSLTSNHNRLTSNRSLASSQRDAALPFAFVSAHTIFKANNGKWLSLLEPPDDLKNAAANCQNNGVFPVLVGQKPERETMLAAPIILYDYPQIAPESVGDFFDGTEIDELLTLRVLTLTEEEKLAMRESDEMAKRILERTENLPFESLLKLHGAWRLKQANEDPDG
jgi:hypothetical protein